MDVNVELLKAQAEGRRWDYEYRMYLVGDRPDGIFDFEKFREKRRTLDFLIREDPCATDDEHTRRIRDLEEELGLYGGRNENG